MAVGGDGDGGGLLKNLLPFLGLSLSQVSRALRAGGGGEQMRGPHDVSVKARWKGPGGGGSCALEGSEKRVIPSWFIHSRNLPAASAVCQAPREEDDKLAPPTPLPIIGDRQSNRKQGTGRLAAPGPWTRPALAAHSPLHTPRPPSPPPPPLSKEVTAQETRAPWTGSAATAPPRSRARAAPAPSPRPRRAAPATRPPRTTPPRGALGRASRPAGDAVGGGRARAPVGGARRAGGTARVQPRWKGVLTERAKPGAPSTPTPWSGSRTPSCASCPG